MAGAGAWASAFPVSPRLPSQKMKRTRAKKTAVTTLIMFAAYPRAGVHASGEVSRTTPVRRASAGGFPSCKTHQTHQPRKGDGQENQHVLGTGRDLSPADDPGRPGPETVGDVDGHDEHDRGEHGQHRYTENPIRTMDSTK